LFPSKWLKASDLPPAGTRVTIAAAELETIRQPDGEQRQALTLAFTAGGRPCAKRLIVNKTQALRFAELAGSEVFKMWVGHQVTLRPAMAGNGRPTIAVVAAADA
jgi:hypothetical protein